MRTDRRYHQRIHVRSQDGAVGGQRVGREPGVETMTPSARNRATLLPSSSTANSPMRAISPFELPLRSALHRRSTGCHRAKRCMKHCPVKRVAARAPALQRGIEIGETNLCEKAKKPQVDAEDRHAGRSENARDSEQCAVPAEHNHQCRTCARAFQRDRRPGQPGVDAPS